MIHRIRLLRNIGQFDSVNAAATIPLTPLVLMYAENERGKTTLAEVLRSLASGDPIPITERRRLAAAHSPHIVLDCDGRPPDAMFYKGTWNRTLPRLALFDDTFVDANIHSGLAVDARHRQNRHEPENQVRRGPALIRAHVHHARQPIRPALRESGQPRSVLSITDAIAAASNTGAGR